MVMRSLSASGIRSWTEELTGLTLVNNGGVGGNRMREPGVRVPGEQALQGGGELSARLGLHMTRKDWTTGSRLGRRN